MAAVGTELCLHGVEDLLGVGQGATLGIVYKHVVFENVATDTFCLENGRWLGIVSDCDENSSVSKLEYKRKKYKIRI